MRRGTVESYNTRKGCGHIKMETGKDLFVHHSDLQRGIQLKSGQLVEFDIAKGQNGHICAINVKVADDFVSRMKAVLFGK